MKKLVFLLALIAFITAAGCSTPEPPSVEPGAPYETAYESAQPETIADLSEFPHRLLYSSEWIINTLTQSEWRGRLTGMPGNYAATVFLEDMFERIGLSPFVGDSFRMGYTQTVFDPDVSNPELTLVFQDQSERQLVFGEEFALNVGLPAMDVSLPMTQDPYHEHMESRFFVGDVWNMQPYALRPVESFRFSHGLGLWGPPPNLNISISQEIYDEVYWHYVEYVNFSITDSATEMTVYNIVGVVPGEDRTRAVVVSAHFDAVGYVGDVYVPGALDNASGVAAMLRAAQIVSHWGSLDTDVVFVAFNGEENGLVGSRAFVAELLELRIYDEIYNLNIDCVGFAYDAPFIVDFSGAGAALALNIATAAVLYEWGFNFEDWIGISDHFSFLERGIPGVVLGQFNTELMQIIHSAQDTVDILDFELIDKVGEITFDIIMRIGGDFSFDIGMPDGFAEEQTSGRITEGLDYIDPYAHEYVISAAREMLEDMGVTLAFGEFIMFRVGDVAVTLTGSGDLLSYEEYMELFPDHYVRREVPGYTLTVVDFFTEERMGGTLVHYVSGHVTDSVLESIFRHTLGEVHTADLHSERTGIVKHFERLNDPESGFFVQLRPTLMWGGSIPSFPDVTVVDEALVGSPNYSLYKMDEVYAFIQYSSARLHGFIGLNHPGKTKEEMVELIILLDIHNNEEYWLALLG